MMNAMMQETIISGTARKAEIPGWTAAGKTGTSQDFRDAWFIGFTGRLVTGVWLGNDDNSPTKKATGGGLPVEVWTRFMRAAHQGQPPLPLPGAGMPSSAMVSTVAQSTRGDAGAAPPQQGYAAPGYAAPAYPPSPAPTPVGNRAMPAPRPPNPTARPEASSGLDGWLVERLFGR
jgi:penicillin-binding protein 1A